MHYLKKDFKNSKSKKKLKKIAESLNFHKKINKLKQIEDIFSEKQLNDLIPDGLKILHNSKLYKYLIWITQQKRKHL